MVPVLGMIPGLDMLGMIPELDMLGMVLEWDRPEAWAPSG